MNNFFIKCEKECTIHISYSNEEQDQQFTVTSFSDSRFECSADSYPEESFFSYRLEHPDLDSPVEGICEFVGIKGNSAFFDMTEFDGDSEKVWAEYIASRLHNLTAKDLMNAGTLSAEANNTVAEVLNEMHKANTGSILITDETLEPKGIFTERDVLMNSLEHGFLNQKVSEYMTSNISVIDESASAEEVYLKFKNASFRHLPVVKEGKLSGMISLRELVRYWTNLLEMQKNAITKKYEKAMSIIVHDLRSPIYAIRSINEMLLHEIDEPENFTAQGFPKLIDDSCGTMISLIDDLLELSETSYGSVSIDTTDVDLKELVGQVLDMFKPSASAKNISIETKMATDMPHLQLDKKRFTQVVQNLVSNAIKYSNSDSTVEIELQQVEENIVFSVIDHGQGIKEAELPKVFDELCKISSKPTANEPSTGLGLSIVKRLVEAHGGTISVESDPGNQTCFSVRLPLSDGEALKAA